MRPSFSTYQTVGYLENDRLVVLELGQRVRVVTVDWDSLATRPTMIPGRHRGSHQRVSGREPGLQDRPDASAELKSRNSEEARQSLGNPQLPACRLAVGIQVTLDWL
jgi:hypothetical protein